MARINQKVGGAELIKRFLNDLSQGSDLIVSAYSGTLDSIPEGQEKIFGRLKSQRILMNTRQGFRLNPNMTSLIGYLMSQNRSRHIEIDLISRLKTLDRIVISYLDHRRNNEELLAEEILNDIEQMTFDIVFTAREAVYSLANRIQTQFGFVRSIKDKISENEEAIRIATGLVNNFTSFTFSHMMELIRQDTPNSPLYSILCTGLLSELATCQSDLNVILIQLREMLATFRSEVHKTNILKAFYEQYNKNTDYRPKDYTEYELPHELFMKASPLHCSLSGHAGLTEDNQNYQDTLGEIAAGLKTPENIPGDEQLLDNSGGLNEAPVIKSEPFAMDDITEELTVFFRECINTGRELSARCYHDEHRLEYLLSHWLFAVAAFYEDMPPENRRYFKCSFNGHGQYHQFVKEQPFNVGNTVLEDVLIQTTGI